VSKEMNSTPEGFPPGRELILSFWTSIDYLVGLLEFFAFVVEL